MRDWKNSVCYALFCVWPCGCLDCRDARARLQEARSTGTIGLFLREAHGAGTGVAAGDIARLLRHQSRSKRHWAADGYDALDGAFVVGSNMYIFRGSLPYIRSKLLH